MNMPVASAVHVEGSAPTQQHQQTNKKAKIDHVEVSAALDDTQTDASSDSNANDSMSEQELCWTAWRLFSSYLEQADEHDNDDENENDNARTLEELCALLQTHQTCKPFTEPLSSIQTVADMLPILLSVVYCFRSEHTISKYFSLKDDRDDDGSHQRDCQLEILLNTCHEYIHRSLTYFPENAATLSMAANLDRVTLTTSTTVTSNRNDPNHQNPDHDPLLLCFGYPKAAAAARNARQQAVQFLDTFVDTDTQEQQQQDPDDINMENVYNPVKEWMEVLLLNQVVGVEWKYTVDDDNDDDDNDDEGANNANDDNGNTNDAKEEEQEQEGYFSASSVEATARFMAAMLLSRWGRHGEALTHLKAFPGLTHRLHPHVWDNNSTSTTCSSPTTNTISTSTTMVPVSFRGDNGVLPPNLYQRMCEVFEPGAAFWKESGYANGNRGYFSFFSNINKCADTDRPPDSDSDQYWQQPANLIDDVVVNHLLPLAQQACQALLKNNNNDDNEKTEMEICAYEWWTHSRSNQANLGHMLHFDTDEADLQGKQEQEVHHPLLSSVLHLTGGGDKTSCSSMMSGATIVLDQTPRSKCVAPVCWRSVPQDNTFMVFPGNLLHGVLPCPGREQQQQTAALSSPSDDPHRLTFMVGWKTRHVPDQRKTSDSFYGPCAPLPPNEKASWVKEIQLGYERNTSSAMPIITREPRQTGNIRMEALPSVSPAWEEIHHHSTDVDGYVDVIPQLQLPSSLDRRFFVSGAPQCFLESLFEDDDT